MTNEHVLGLIGFGEAGQALAEGWRTSGKAGEIYAVDLVDKTAAAKKTDVTLLTSIAEVCDTSDRIISAVTASEQMNVVREVAQLRPHQLFLDINSVAPQKKQAASQLLGPGYLDLAVLSPIHPAKHESPVLAAGAISSETLAELQTLFPDLAIASATVGDASLFKMIRSVFVKGIEAVATECALAAHKSGLADRLFPSLDLTLRHETAQDLINYTMERVAVHGLRRAAEMEEVCTTLADLNLPSHMSEGAVALQRMVGALELTGVSRDSASISHDVLARLD